MHLKSLWLRDFLAHADTKIEFGATPIVLLVGPNESGKSSVVDAARWALLNRARGLAARDNRLLVRRGADTGRVMLTVVHGGKEFVVTRTPSTGDPSQEKIRAALALKDDEALEAALDGGRFLALTPKERKAIVFRLAGAEVGEGLLLQNGIDDPEVVRLCLAKGFDAGEKQATEKKRTANRTAEEIRLPAPEDAEVSIGNATYRLGALTEAQCSGSLRKIRDDRDGLLRRISTSQALRQQIERATGSWENAQAGVDSATRTLKTTEDRVAKAAGERKDPAALREQAATLDSSIADPAPVAPASFSPERARDTMPERQAVLDWKGRLATARRSPWAQVRRLLDELRADPKLGPLAEAVPFIALLALVADNADDTTALEAHLSLANAALEKAEAEASRITAANLRAQDEHRAALDLYLQRANDHAARVALARKTRTDLLNEAYRMDNLATVDQRAVESAKASVRSAEAHLAGVSGTAPKEQPENVEAMQEEVNGLDSRIRSGEEISRRVGEYHRAAAAYADAEERRAALAKEGERFEAMEHALRPSGVMGQLLAAPLKRLRDVLAEIAPRILPRELRVTDEWEVTYDGAPVSLASTSARWRAGAALALAVGAVSGLRWAVLDEASVCVGRTRDALTDCLLKVREHFDQVVIVASRSEAEMAALQPPPAALRGVVATWAVEAGRVRPVEAPATVAV